MQKIQENTFPGWITGCTCVCFYVCMNMCMYINIHSPAIFLQYISGIFREIYTTRRLDAHRAEGTFCVSFCSKPTACSSSSRWQRTQLPSLITDVMEHSYRSLQPACALRNSFRISFLFLLSATFYNLPTVIRSVYSWNCTSFQNSEVIMLVLTLILMLTQSLLCFHPSLIYFDLIPIYTFFQDADP